MALRMRTAVGIGLLTALALSFGAAARAAPPSGGDISGVWVLMGYRSTSLPAAQRIPQTIEGGTPPMLPWAEKLYKQRWADSDNGKPFAGPSTACLPNGMPLMMMGASYPIQVLQTPGQITLLFEELHLHRMIYLNEKHPADVEPGFLGHSVGHWEGDTLVVDTVGLTERTLIDFTGMPHSADLHLIEHIRKTDPQTLEDLITVDDPKTFSKPWTTRMRYRASSERLQEYFCDNNRNTPSSDNLASFKLR